MRGRMKIGITLGHVGDTVQDTVRFAVQAEQAGLPIVGMGDVPSVFREAYGLLMACALATSRVQLGPTVTNPVIRHPYVTASSIATIDEASGGRAFVVIGTGNASVRNLGVPKARIADLEAAVRMIRTGFVESAAKDDGSRSRTEQRQSPLEWPTCVVPLYVAAGTGLRSLKVAADYADGVMLHTVAGDLALARRRVEQLKEMRAAGPRPATRWRSGSMRPAGSATPRRSAARCSARSSPGVSESSTSAGRWKAWTTTWPPG